MRRPPVFALLLLLFAVVVAGCGSDAPRDPARVVESWSQAINASDDDTAAGLFAPATATEEQARNDALSLCR